MLKLSFVQGPRDGQSMEYKPGSTIRIGRVVRGNEIAIKDAGISTKHLRIDSDSNNWIIHDLGSSNGTILNSDTLDPESPVVLSHGDIIKLGELTSFVVNFVTVDVQAEEEQEHKLPPRPRRNNRRLPVPDPDPTQDQPEVPKRTRGRPSKTTAVEPEVKSRVSRSRKKEEIGANPSEILKEGTVKNPIKLEPEETPNRVDISANKRESRRKHTEKAFPEVETMKEEDIVVEEKEGKRPSRSTRSKKSEVGGDPLLELDKVLKQARANKKQQTSKSVVRNDSVEAEKTEADDGSKRVDELIGEDVEKDDVTCVERDSGIEEARKETSGDEGVDNTKVELKKKMTLGEWFSLLEVQMSKQITEETDKLIEPMRNKSLRVHTYIQEQKQAKKESSLS